MSKKILKGKVVSNKSLKTLVVDVVRIKEHPKYKKRFLSHKKYKAHYENGSYNVGDEVVLQESLPRSKDKRWIVVTKDNLSLKESKEE